MKSGKDRRASRVWFVAVAVLVKEEADGLMPERPVSVVRAAPGTAVVFSLGGGHLGDCVKSDTLNSFSP